MKKIFFLVLIMQLALSINCHAQVNYLFSSSSKPYVSIVDGIAPQLIMVPPFNANPPWTLSDEGFARVPIGFSFYYNGKSYDSANICANGFVTLGDTIFRRISPLRLYNNSLAGNPFYVDGVKPLLAPFWDDLDLVDTRNLVYKTTGRSPFRVFTVEWKKTRWTFESTDPALSMEVKLYEKTNIIEFHYKDEGGLPYTPRAFASIGITSAANDFISLQNASSNPPLSVIQANDSLTVKPADNQLYTFTPSDVVMLEKLFPSISYTNNNVSFEIKPNDEKNYEYSISKSSSSPLAGTETKPGNIAVTGLEPATNYYVYQRALKNKNFYSQWTADQFSSAVDPVELPWHISGNPNVYPFLPPDVRQQSPYGHSSVASDAFWSTIVDFPEFGDTAIWSLNTFYNDVPESWLFTPGLKLTAGKTYQLKFGYLSFPIYEEGEIASFEVKYGKATGAVAMTSGTLFKREDIVTDFNFAPESFEDTTIQFTPDQSGAYFIGFHNFTKRFNGHEGPVPVIRNITVTEKETMSQPFIVLNGKSASNDNVFTWKTRGNKIKKIVLQKSKDGIHFTDIKNTPVSASVKSTSPLASTFKLRRSIEVSAIEKKKERFSKAYDEPAPSFEMQVSKDGSGFTKLTAAALK